jgi:hypothetical protein
MLISDLIYFIACYIWIRQQQYSDSHLQYGTDFDDIVSSHQESHESLILQQYKIEHIYRYEKQNQQKAQNSLQINNTTTSIQRVHEYLASNTSILSFFFDFQYSCAKLFS